MLQKDGEEIELISDENIYRFVQKGLRVRFGLFSFFPPRIFTQVTQGGLCQILSKRCHAGPGSEDLCKLIQPALKVNLVFFPFFSTN